MATFAFQKIAMLRFTKYQGTGNDFILVDDRGPEKLSIAQEQIASLCDRRFGIGADGLMLLRDTESYDFEMVYFNADGRTSSMCGNGGRCIAHFASELGMVGDSCRFVAIDGPHEAIINGNMVSLKMSDVDKIDRGDGFSFVDTGSPHYILRVEELDDPDFVLKAGSIRYSEPWKKGGVNVNFVMPGEGMLEMRTYERGVEDETLSCGTGVTAAALWLMQEQKGISHVLVKTKGGKLSVKAEQNGEAFSEIWLQGPVSRVFDGEISY